MKSIIKFVICALVLYYVGGGIGVWTENEFGLIADSTWVMAAVMVVAIIITMVVYLILSSILDGED
jgi:hypothetical protein